MQFNLWLSLVAALLLATGGRGWFHGGAEANASRNAIKETVPGSVLSTNQDPY